MQSKLHPMGGRIRRSLYEDRVQISKLTYIQVADACFEGDDRSYRHVEIMSLVNEITMTKAISMELAHSK
jgi:hypothetical protein